METFSPYLDKEYNPLLAGSIDGTDEEPHDKAISRALVATYKPNKFIEGDPNLTLFVGRLSPKTNEETIWNAFRKFGKIKRQRLVRDIVTGFSKCYAFVEFEDDKALRQAHREGHKMIIDESEILVEYELGRTLKNWVPRRLGGGFGGKKESGQLRFGGRDRPFRKPIDLGSSMNRWGREEVGSLRGRPEFLRHDWEKRDERNRDSNRSRDRHSESRRHRDRSRHDNR